MTTLPASGEAETGHYLAPWCTEDDLPVKRLADVTDVKRAFAIAAATNLLYLMSGRQYRSGRSVIRPTAISNSWNFQNTMYPYSSMSGYGGAWGFAAGWAWTAMGMGWWQNGEDTTRVQLTAPVRRINMVMVDGAVLDPSMYKLFNRKYLYRMLDATGQANGSWPWQQNIQMPITEPGTWVIDYEWGKGPPPAGVMACISLSTELALAMSGAKTAKLSDRIITISTEGTNVAVGEAMDYLKESFTSLPLVDMFLQAVNPQKLRRRSVFLGPNSITHMDQGQLS